MKNKWIKRFLTFMIVLLAIYEYHFPPFPRKKKHKVYDYAIVLGCPNKKDGSLCTSQIKRCELAIDAYQRGYYKTLVITGGKTKYGFIEAQEMNHYIQQRIQIPYVLETEAQNTIENFKYTKKIIGDASILIITSGTHIRRACALARKHFSVYAGIYYPEHRWKHIRWEIGARALYLRDSIFKGRN